MPKVTADYLAARRSEIIEAAREVFAERGFAGTSMADLVAASGVSMGALYRYFPSKSDLVLAVVDGRDGRVDGGFDAAEPATDIVSRLLDYVSDGERGLSHARLVAQIWGEAAISPDLARTACAEHAGLRDHFAGQLARARGGRTSAVDRQQAEVALAALIGYADLQASGYELDRRAFEKALKSLLRLDPS